MNVGVLGAGTTGRDVARLCAAAGHHVTVRDVGLVERGVGSIESNPGVVGGRAEDSGDRRAALERITVTADLAEAVTDADVVVEALPGGPKPKREAAVAIEGAADPGTVIASHAASFPTGELASALDRPERAIGLRFSDPVHLMDLVEVVAAERTAAGTVEFAEGFVEGIGKEPVTVRDTPGVVTSRLGVAIGVEAIRMVERGVAGPVAVDRTMELGYGHPRGPLELADVVGLDSRLELLEGLREELGERFRPPQLLKRKVRSGNLGRKTGEGFYVWEDGERVAASGDSTER